jgi:hypothetical protein
MVEALGFDLHVADFRVRVRASGLGVEVQGLEVSVWISGGGQG